MLKQKDIFALGIAILEFMVGRHVDENPTAALAALPESWANCPEATALVQTLVQCIDMNLGIPSHQRLRALCKFVVAEYRRFYDEDRQEQDFGGTINTASEGDLANRRAAFQFLNGEWDRCERLLNYAFELEKGRIGTRINQLLLAWQGARLSDEELSRQLLQTQSVQAYCI